MVLVAPLALVVVCASSLLARAPLTASAAPPLQFARPVVSGINGIGYEQNLRIDSQGRIYTSVPDGAPSGGSFLWHSTDGGLTFKPVGATAPLTHTVPEPCPGGGGDTELAVDPEGNVYFNDLTLANFSTGRSSNGGLNFAPQNCLSVANAVVDRQWYAVDGDPMKGGTLYMAYDAVAQSSVACPGVTGANNELQLARSPAAGDLTGASAGVAFAPPNNITAPCEEGIMGNVEVSPTTHEAFVIHDDMLYQQVRITKCVQVDFVLDPSGLSCTDSLVSAFPNAITAANFPTLGIDSAGELYALWEQAPCGPCGFNPTTSLYQGAILGDTVLMMSVSTNDGASWSTPAQVPTPGLHNNVYADIVGGSAGRADIAWYGTSSAAPAGSINGPDSVTGDWGVYVAQTRDGGNTFSQPTLASETMVHRGTMQTLLGGQVGNRTLGDFLQIRLGLQGQAEVTYADSNLQIGTIFTSQAMFVQQIGGSSAYASYDNVHGASPATNGVTAQACNATFDAQGVSTGNMPNLDILSSSISMPDPAHYQVSMTVADLTSLAPSGVAGGPDLVWQTQWHMPVSPLGTANGGHVWFAYMESDNGGAPTFFDGESASTTFENGGNGSVTYPGANQITGSYTPTAPGTITINVPVADVSDATAISSTLFSVTASTMSYPVPANTAPNLGGIGGELFNTIDVAPPYDFIPSQGPPKLTIPTASC